MREIVEERVVATGPAAPEARPIRAPWLSYRRLVASILRIQDTPEAVARGVALGALIAMTPTVGVQMLMVLVVHTACRANRLAGILMVYISNPFTLIPIYWLDYALGCFLLGIGPSSYGAFAARIGSAREYLGRWELWNVTRELLAVGGDLVGPMALGGLVIGAAAAVPLYFAALAALKRHARVRPGRGDRYGALR